MARRKGLGKGKGKGYKNLQGRDPKIHSDSARGRKQPQKIGYIHEGNLKTQCPDCGEWLYKDDTHYVCQKDTDGDGVPDSKDCDPNDPNKQDTKKEDLQKEFNEKKESIEYKDYYKEDIKSDFLRLGVHNEENPITIDDYPYGFRLRTKIRYWIETTNRGDRFVSQTLNPKTGNWNKPKKSTYSDVMVLIGDEQGHVSYISASINDTQDKAKAYLEKFGDDLSKTQKIRLHKIVGWDKAMQKVEVKVVQQRFKHKDTGKIVEQVPIMQMNDYYKVDEKGKRIDEEKEKKQQKEVKESISKYASYQATKSFLGK